VKWRPPLTLTTIMFFLIWSPKSFDSTANFTVEVPMDFHCVTILVMSFEMYTTSMGGVLEWYLLNDCKLVFVANAAIAENDINIK
jgi:hypothetical protein